jgi:lysophospholipid acyltransferase (LPLAT)-like uncharacterized protein
VDTTKQQAKTKQADLESRGRANSSRKRSRGRRVYFWIGLTLMKFLIRVLWRTYRIKKVIGADIADRVHNAERPYAPCFWHQHLMLCGKMVYDWHRDSGYEPCLVVSASVDGDVPSKFAEDLGARVVRGSSNRGGAKVLRDMTRAFREGSSIYTTADGPTGPNRKFKEGVVLMARVANVPMVPFAFAVDRAWYLKRWDSFMIPKPFARVVVAFGEPVSIPKGTPVRELEPWRLEMENAVNDLVERSNRVFEDKME